MNQICHPISSQEWDEKQYLDASKRHEKYSSNEPAFNNITQLIAQICNVPIAIITLISDGRLQFKSIVATDLQKIPPEHFFTSGIVLQPDLVIISDTQEDTRFNINQLLPPRAEVRFYAGISLMDSIGTLLGTLCILDHKPRKLSELQILTLRSLARQATTELEFRQVLDKQQTIVELLQNTQVELQEAKQAADSANDRKSRVLAFVCHEFKNPLNATIMFGEMLKSGRIGELNTPQSEYVQHMLTGCQHLKDLMDDILDIAPVEVGLFKLSFKTVPIRQVLTEVETIIKESALRKDISLVFEVQSGIDLVNADPKRLRQILINLLSNAIKYTSASDTVYLKIRLVDDWLEYRVIDHGPGIAEDEIQRLFADYYRVQNTFSSQKEGLGLGLALIKTLVELHNGTIEIESVLGKGTSFIMKLPVLIQESDDQVL